MPLSCPIHQEPKFMFYSRKLLTPIGIHIFLKLPAKPLGLPLPGLPGSYLFSRHFANGCCSCGRAAPHFPSNNPFQRKQGACLHPHSVFKTVCSSAQAAVAKHHELPSFNNRNLFLAALRAGRSQIKVLASLVLGASSFRLADGCLLSISSRGPQTGSRGKDGGAGPFLQRR